MKVENLELNLVRSRRKTIGVEVTLTGKVIVRAPHKVSNSRIRAFVKSKHEWINRHRNNALKKTKEYPTLHYEDGDIVHLLGEEYSLQKAINDRTQILFKDTICKVEHPTDNIQEVLTKWYKDAARKHLTRRVNLLSDQYEFEFSGLRITNAKTRWGSCGVKNSLNFSWRLIKAPEDVIDYVVLHELVHTEFKNHGRSFWSRLGEVNPSYRKNRRWLKENALILLRD